jgi:hypothetical protein
MSDKEMRDEYNAQHRNWPGLDWFTWQIAWHAARGAAPSQPIICAYEWDYSPGVIRRSFDPAPYNGRHPDRTITLCAAPASNLPSKDGK